MKRIKALSLLLVLVLFCLPSEARRKPVIGIAPGYKGAEYSNLRRTYTDAILRSGGIPFILPQVSDASSASEILRHVDGVMLTGGVDLDPAYYGEAVLNETVEVDSHRDTVDILYARAAIEGRLPVLAICRGEQLMNVVLGGSLYQDLPTQKPSGIMHRQKEDGIVPTHEISVERESMLYRIMGSDRLKVNSLHHQAVKDLSPLVTVTARADDGVVEAYESNEKGRWLLAVQFHPEVLVRVDYSWLKLFKAFVKAAR